MWLIGYLVLYGFLLPSGSNTACTIKDLNATHPSSFLNSDAVFKIKGICCNMSPVRSFCWSEGSVYVHAVPSVLKSHTVNGGIHKRCEELRHCRCDHSDVANLCLNSLQSWNFSNSMYLPQLVPCSSLWNCLLGIGSVGEKMDVWNILKFFFAYCFLFLFVSFSLSGVAFFKWNVTSLREIGGDGDWERVANLVGFSW